VERGEWSGGAKWPENERENLQDVLNEWDTAEHGGVARARTSKQKYGAGGSKREWRHYEEQAARNAPLCQNALRDAHRLKPRCSVPAFLSF